MFGTNCGFNNGTHGGDCKCDICTILPLILIMNCCCGNNTMGGDDNCCCWNILLIYLLLNCCCR